jgi:ABC-type antimicrobial peptide transport system permease subunit
VVENLFGPGQTPLDQTIRIKNVPFRVVGVLTVKGQTPQGSDQDDIALIPFSTAERRVLGSCPRINTCALCSWASHGAAAS